MKWRTVKETAFFGCVAPHDCDPRAHGGVTVTEEAVVPVGSPLPLRHRWLRYENRNQGFCETGMPYMEEEDVR